MYVLCFINIHTQYVYNIIINILLIIGDGQNACDDGRIECYAEGRFSLECSGADACDELSCTCNADECEISGDLKCTDTKQSKNTIPQIANENGFLPKDGNKLKMLNLKNPRKSKLLKFH